MSDHIRLTDVVKQRLEKYRDNHGHNSMDSAVREIMIAADIDIYKYHNEEQEEEDENDESTLEDKFGWDQQNE